MVDQPLSIGGRVFTSRLIVGTGKYRTIREMQAAIAASGADMVTVAIRRVQLQSQGHLGLMEALDWNRYWLLPNTAGCQTAEEAMRVARLGREMAQAVLGQTDNTFVKLEVIRDPRYLLPDPIGTYEAAKQLVQEGFTVLPYIHADPQLALHLQDIGCATVMPLGSPIGSGQGLRHLDTIRMIVEQSQVPVIVDAGIGVPSEASQGMEVGADGLLINTAIAQAGDPVAMAEAMKLATQAGRMAHLAGRIPIKPVASPSSPTRGVIGDPEQPLSETGSPAIGAA